MNKTNIELARECQLLDGLSVIPSQVDRYTALVEARLIEKLGPVTAQPAQELEDLSGVRVCCGEYAKCHRPCTPRGAWQASQAQPARKPLTAEQREEIARFLRRGNWTLGDVIDAVEAAHGIGGKT